MESQCGKEEMGGSRVGDWGVSTSLGTGKEAKSLIGTVPSLCPPGALPPLLSCDRDVRWSAGWGKHSSCCRLAVTASVTGCAVFGPCLSM